MNTFCFGLGKVEVTKCTINGCPAVILRTLAVAAPMGIKEYLPDGEYKISSDSVVMYFPTEEQAERVADSFRPPSLNTD
jgi:hypothetical protein